MNKMKSTVIYLAIASIAIFNVANAAEKCVTTSANRSFAIYDAICLPNHFVKPEIYVPARPDYHLIPINETGGGCGGRYYLRDHDDHGNLLSDSDYGNLKSTVSEHFPSGYPNAEITINIETEDSIGEPLVCDFKFKRQNGTLEVCSVDSNPDYCDLKSETWAYLFIGKMTQAQKQEMMKESNKHETFIKSSIKYKSSGK